MIAVKFEDRRINAALDRIAERGGDLSRPLSACGEIMLTSIDKNFQAQGRFSSVGDVRGGSNRWQPLAPATKLQRIGGNKAFKKSGGLRKAALRNLGGMKILQRTGDLASSFSKQVSGNQLAVGSHWPYAAIHHHGGQAGRGRKVTIPARPILVVQDEDVGDMLDILARHITS